MKDDIPPLRMAVEAGKLTPADAFSAERLESYRHGTTMFVQPITDPQSKKRRKFWAILRLVIKNCETPWRTVKDAANAIKRTFGLMDDGGTTGNVRIMYPRSLNDLTEPEFEEFYEDAMLYLQRVTGVDPETLSKEAPDAGDDEPPASDGLPDARKGSGGASPTSAAATPDRDECISKFLQFAADQDTAPQWKLENLVPTVKAAWVQQLPDDIPFVEACCRTAEQLIRGEIKGPEATRYLHALAAKAKENGNGHDGRSQANLRSGQSGR